MRRLLLVNSNCDKTNVDRQLSDIQTDRCRTDGQTDVRHTDRQMSEKASHEQIHTLTYPCTASRYHSVSISYLTPG